MSDNHTNGGAREAFIGVDVGGTHTDVAVMYRGTVERGKALTTYDDFSRGVLEAVEVAARSYDVGMDELLDSTRLFINGTTVVTNAITQLRGSRVGVLITSGFRDAFRLAGGPRTTEIDDHLQLNVPDLVDRRALAEIDERIDWSGTILVPIDLEQVKAETRRLVEEVGIDAIVDLLPLEPRQHRARARGGGGDQGGVPRPLRDPVAPRLPGRGRDAALDDGDPQLVRPGRRRRVPHLAQREAARRGARRRPRLLPGPRRRHQPRQGARRTRSACSAPAPPAARSGANELAKRMGKKRVLLGDMGGTSFDTGIIVDNEIHIEKNLELGPFMTGVNLVDVISVGAGGGSIGWVSERGVPQVGPRVAGSSPGPAALDRGGDEPTVTDAMVTLGFIDPDNYLGGRVPAEAGAVARGPRPHVRRPLRLVDRGGGRRDARPRRRQHGERGPGGQRRQGPRPARVPVPLLRRHAAAVRVADRRAPRDQRRSSSRRTAPCSARSGCCRRTT